MNSDYFVTGNYKISKPNKFLYVDIIKNDKSGVISMDYVEIYDLLKKKNLDTDGFKYFLLSHMTISDPQIKYQTKQSSRYLSSSYTSYM
jgi:hypothetical protein